MVTWKRPGHWASAWSRGRAERARQRAAASRLRGAVHLRCTRSARALYLLGGRFERVGLARESIELVPGVVEQRISTRGVDLQLGLQRAHRVRRHVLMRRRRRQQWWWLSMDARARVRACIQQPIGYPRPLQHGRPWLCALEQQEHLLQQRTNRRVGYARFGSNLPRVPSEQGTDAGVERVVVDVRVGEDARACRAAWRLDDREAWLPWLVQISRLCTMDRTTILRVASGAGLATVVVGLGMARVPRQNS